MRPPVRYLGELTLLAADAARGLVHRPLEISETLAQMNRLGVRSLPLVGLTTLFTGAVMTLQVSYSLSAYGANAFVGAFNGLSIVKELGPVLSAIMMAGRVGAGITAELGAMQVTEQVDAMRALGANPAKKLVLPRLCALIVLLPFLTMIADALGIVGGMLVAFGELGQPAGYYYGKVIEYVTIGDIASGLAKSVVFAVVIGIIACRNGLDARGGATGVGRATTDTVVTSSISIFIGNFFLSKALIVLQSSAGR